MMRKALQAQLADITKTPEATATADPRLLDQLPIIEADFSQLAEDLADAPLLAARPFDEAPAPVVASSWVGVVHGFRVG